MRRVELRSDTFTRPTRAMRHAMATAVVGDDVYGEDPTVNELEQTVAGMFGMAAAVFMPTGSMGNQVALQLLVPPGDELLTDADAHVVTYELGAAARYGGIQTRTVVADRGVLDPAVVAAQVRPDGWGTVPTRAVSVENTHNRGGGAVYPFETLAAVGSVCRDAGVALHCDGARLWHAAVAQDRPLPAYGALFDTLMVSVSKGLAAPVGSLLLGGADLMAEARAVRKRLGGGMRQSGVLAAAALVAVRDNVGRLADDHARARRLAVACADAAAGVVDVDAVETNIVVVDLAGHPLDARDFAARAADRGVHVGLLAPQRVRLLTHLDVDDDDIAYAADVLAGVLQS
ncbi:MAG TPA: GntG family PLP-dependent aldolase [Mycobacteriales bacterium]|nr:GntG family PLP-dependent aldolase [Mycobacteriales bacterium]